jgi:phosphatidylethanolamine-binding protein (PEBP) family uncharacterized protein
MALPTPRAAASSSGRATRTAVIGIWAVASACSTAAPSPGSLGGTGASGAGVAGGASVAGSGAAGMPVGGSSGGVGGSADVGGMAQLAGSAGSSAGGTSGGFAAAPGFVLTIPALENIGGCSLEMPRVCDVFPDANVSYMGNANVSPELHWAGVPSGTMSLAVVLFDATFGQAHWALWNIPASVTTLAADVPKNTATPPSPPGSRQANANFAPEGDGYFGPHVPCNVFELQLYALSVSNFAPQTPDSAVLVSIELQELGNTVLGVAKLTGRSNDYMMACE